MQINPDELRSILDLIERLNDFSDTAVSVAVTATVADASGDELGAVVFDGDGYGSYVFKCAQ